MMMTRVSLFHFPPGGGLYPVSLGYIAASLKSHHVDTTLEDLTLDENKNFNQVLDRVRKFRPHIAGFSAYEGNIRMVLMIADLIKKIDPKIMTVIGGPQVTFMPKEALLEMSSIDVLCRGEGEVVLPSLCDHLNNGQGLEQVQGIAFRKNGALIETRPGELTRNLDDLPSPYAAGVVDLLHYQRGIILTSRGCPFNCHFCYTPKAYRRTIRYHSAERVLEDLGFCIQNKVEQFFFADPSFTADRARALSILRGIIHKGWKINIWCETRSDLVDEELLRIMSRAGVRYIAYGLETVDKKVMKAINKEIDLKVFKRAVKLTQDFGMQAEVFTLFGLPKQTYKSACKTLEFVRSLKVPIISNSSGQLLGLFFGTQIYDQMEKFGIYPVKRKRPLYLSPGKEFKTSHMSKRELVLIKKRYRAEQRLDVMSFSEEELGITLCG